MELVKEQAEQPLEFKYQDAVFLVKRHATGYDRFVVVTSEKSRDFLEETIRRMVVGWRNVTMDGKPVPYSFDALKLFPHSARENVFVLLADFIHQHTDILKKEVPAEKNG